ncbi:MAG TPA: DUF5665 domain-containing protein [Clostridia bacterium]
MARVFSYNQKPSKYKYSKFKRIRSNLLSSFMFGVMRGLGMAVGFSGLAVILLYIIRFIPLYDIPILGEIVRAIIENPNK